MSVTSSRHEGVMRRTTLPAVSMLAVLAAIALTSACGSVSESRTGISGSVLDWGAFGGTTPAANVPVVCVDASSRAQVQTTRTGRDGRFFLSVPAGRYLVDYASGGRPGWTEVEVVAGEVATLEPFIGRRGGPHASPDQKRLKEILQPEAIALGMKRQTAKLAVSGATVGAAMKLFGTTPTLPADTHVWVCVVTGEVKGRPSSEASRDLARGGFVAYELRASALKRLATRSVPRKWRVRDWTDPDDWGGTLIVPLF